jgi:uncharacterized caspase-like protein
MGIYVGMDVHRKRSQVAVLDDAGVQQRNRNVPNDPAQLVPVLGALPPGTPVAFEARTLFNRPAHEVQLAVEDVLADRGKDDLVLLYFSCHGVKHPSGRLYFATSTTRRDRLAATAVPSEFLKEQIDHSTSRRVLALLDCCYSGAFARGLTAKGDQRVDLAEPFQAAAAWC